MKPGLLQAHSEVKRWCRRRAEPALDLIGHASIPLAALLLLCSKNGTASPLRRRPSNPSCCTWSVRRSGSAQLNAFLSHLAVKEHVSASTQTQALSALVFLYRNVLERVVLLACRLLYGSGLRLLECLHMRVKDIEMAIRLPSVLPLHRSPHRRPPQASPA